MAHHQATGVPCSYKSGVTDRHYTGLTEGSGQTLGSPKGGAAAGPSVPCACNGAEARPPCQGRKVATPRASNGAVLLDAHNLQPPSMVGVRRPLSSGQARGGLDGVVCDPSPSLEEPIGVPRPQPVTTHRGTAVLRWRRGRRPPHHQASYRRASYLGNALGAGDPANRIGPRRPRQLPDEPLLTY